MDLTWSDRLCELCLEIDLSEEVVNAVQEP